MAHGLHPVAVGIEHEGGEVVGVILWPKTWLTVALAPGMKGRHVKCLNRRAIRRAEAQVHATSGPHLAHLDGDRELDAKRACHRAIVGAPLLKINDANNPKWQQHGVVEPTAALQVAYPKRDVIEHSLRVLVRSNRMPLSCGGQLNGLQKLEL